MKKKVLSLAVLMTMGVFAYAYTVTNVNSPDENAIVLVQDDGYKTIEVKDLDPVIQEAISAYEELFAIENVAYNEAESLTKLSMTLKSDDSKKEVILDKEGKELEPAEVVEPTPAVEDEN